MATHQPNMDALNKAAKKRKANHPNANPEMTKKIGSLYKHWQKLWLRSSERHRQLLEARTRLKDIALARSFNFDNWRKRFNAWVDQQKLRLNDLFRRFDGNHDGMLTREEFMKALKASGKLVGGLTNSLPTLSLTFLFSLHCLPFHPTSMFTSLCCLLALLQV